ncbi:MAG: AraC family transcriptional regulator [Pseudomonadota bacterium]
MIDDSAHGPVRTQSLTRLIRSSPLDVFALLALVSLTSFILSSAVPLSPLTVLLSVLGTASCGFSWLFARALFRSDAGEEVWPLFVVAVLVVTGGVLEVFSFAGNSSSAVSTGLGMSKSVHGLVSSAVLLLAFLEAFLGFRAGLPHREKVFRLVYALGYGLLLTVSVIWLRAAAEGSWADRSSLTIKIICALAALHVGGLAWAYRRRNPLPKAPRKRRQVGALSKDDVRLADKIRVTLGEERFFLEPDLKLSDLAKRLGEQDYKVSQCITGALGFRNFNQMINHYRIEAAKDVLSDPATQRMPILTVALDVGFGSIGPFNRAFKAETGQTPGAFRNNETAAS